MELWLDLTVTGASGIATPGASSALIADGDEAQRAPADLATLRVVGAQVLDEAGSLVGERVSIDEPAAQEAARARLGLVPWLLVNGSDWRLIPLENLVAASRGTGTRIAAEVRDAALLQGAAGALDIGVDGLVLPADADLWTAAAAWTDTHAPTHGVLPRAPSAELVPLEVISVEPAGMGDRVCIDLTSTLELGEGLLLGSTSQLLVLVHGETLVSGYVPPRPFRVNAGAVHSYVLGADGARPYLADLAAADRLEVVDSTGSRREATIGRLKRERRPLVMMRLRHGAVEGQVFLQQAETVRLVREGGAPVDVTTLAPGMWVLGQVGDTGRHLGQAIPADVEES